GAFLTSTKDANQLTTTYDPDGFGRNKKITRPNGTAVEVIYSDCGSSCLANSEHRTTVTVNELNSGSTTPRTTAYTYLDRLDRPIVNRRKLLDGTDQWT